MLTVCPPVDHTPLNQTLCLHVMSCKKHVFITSPKSLWVQSPNVQSLDIGLRVAFEKGLLTDCMSNKV